MRHIESYLRSHRIGRWDNSSERMSVYIGVVLEMIHVYCPADYPRLPIGDRSISEYKRPAAAVGFVSLLQAPVKLSYAVGTIMVY